MAYTRNGTVVTTRLDMLSGQSAELKIFEHMVEAQLKFVNDLGPGIEPLQDRVHGIKVSTIRCASCLLERKRMLVVSIETPPVQGQVSARRVGLSIRARYQYHLQTQAH